MLVFSVVALTGLAFLGTMVAARDPALDKAWEDWKKTYSKVYRQRTEAFRRSVWETNLRMIEQHNREADEGHHTFVMAMNHLGDLTRDEFNEKMNGFRPDLGSRHLGKATVFVPSPNAKIPECVDWRSAGIVTPVKDQGSCGSCWAFSAIGALESLHARKNGRLIPLSEQNLVDCSWDYGNYGCNGGWPSAAFQYIQDNYGVNSEAIYPYEAVDGTCRFRTWDRASTCTSYVSIPQDDERALEEAVATVGPVSVALDASNFQFYNGGIYLDPNCGTTLNHAVLAVGYCRDSSGLDYWIVKNSWGQWWGEDGYIRIAKGHNQCGIAQVATYPL